MNIGSKHLTSYFYLAKLFKQSGIADVKFVRNINAKQRIFTNSGDVKKYIPMHIKQMCVRMCFLYSQGIALESKKCEL